jgi:hypothetical protein
MDTRSYHNHFLLWFLCLAILFPLSQTHAQVHSIDKSFLVESGGTLRMNVATGNIVVRGWEYDEVRVQVEVFGSPRALDNLELRLEQDGNDVVIRTQRVGQRRFRDWTRHRNERIEFTVHVPYHYNVRVTLAAGRIDVDDIDGSVQVRTAAGSINITNIYGPIDADASTGSINVSLLNDSGSVNLNTATGSISINVPEDINARFSLNTAVGRVRCSLRNYTGSGSRIQFQYNDGGPLIKANAAIGSITVQSN